MRRFFLVLVMCAIGYAAPSSAQTASCTTLTVGQTQDITAHSVCKKVTLNSVPNPTSGVASICVPTNTTAAEWQSFYDNPPAGVTIAACASSCTGYSYGGYCYHYAGDAVSASCDTVCTNTPAGACDLAGTKHIGSDDGTSARCSAVATHFAGVSVTANSTSGATGDGCFMNSLKGGWNVYNMTSPTTSCTDTANSGRICACRDACPAGGVSYNGHCYYKGNAGQTCNDVCASLGGCSAAGTNALLTQAHCTAVGNSYGSSWGGGMGGMSAYVGCFRWQNNGSTYIDIDTGSQSCAASRGDVERYCACNGNAPVNGQCGSNSCISGTYQFVSNGYMNCGAQYGPYTYFNCLGINGGSNAMNCFDGTQLDSCCAGLPC